MRSGLRRTVVATAMLMSACAAGGSGADIAAGGSAPGSAGAVTLIGTSWLAEDIGGTGVVDRLQTTLSFTGDGRVSGSGGCNRYFGPVTVSGEAIRFGAMAATRMACPPAVMNQEQRFFAALGRAESWKATAEGKLILTDAAGEPLVSFSRLPTGGPGG